MRVLYYASDDLDVEALKKETEGKDKYLIYNNGANKLLKMMCAKIKDHILMTIFLLIQNI